MCVGFTFCFEHNFIQLQLSFLSGIVKHQISCRGLKPNFQHNTIINCNFCSHFLKLSSFWQQVSPLFFKHPSLTFWQLLFPPLESPLRADVGPFPLELRVLEPEKSFDPFLLVLSGLWFLTSLVLLGSTTASQRDLAAAQAAELGGKEKALTGFLGFLASSWRAF